MSVERSSAVACSAVFLCAGGDEEKAWMLNMKHKKHNKNTEGGFVAIRRGIYEHLADGRLKGKEWMVYSTLHLKADHETGICYKISAPALGYLLGEKPHYINRILRSLEKKGYIRRISHRGQVVCYPVVINKFLTSNGILIDAHKTKSLNEIAWYTEYDCTLTVLQRSVNCTSNVRYLSCLQEVKNITILKEVNKSKGKEPTASPVFTPPIPQQVREYAASIGFPEINPEHFCQYYAANDWRLKSGKPMRNWKQAIVTWKNNSKGKRNGGSKVSREFVTDSKIGETIEA